MEREQGIVEERIEGSRINRFLQELFGNAAHFPLANIFLELLLRGPGDYLGEADPYVLFAAALVQAWFAATWSHRGSPRPLLANLIGPALYTALEISLEGGDFFAAPHHVAYWGFAVTLGLLQEARARLPSPWRTPLILAENLTRTSIVLIMYAILEFESESYHGIADFLSDESHLFITVVVPLLGLILGLAHLNGERHLTTLRATARQLREYSEWLFGSELLSRAVRDPASLTLARRERCMLFMDIRGFTAWSERHEPEQVVELINAYYAAAEPYWRDAIRVKLTADEIMLVFAEPLTALHIAISVADGANTLLAPHGLSVGSGLHLGPVVEGLMGGCGRQSYDLLGDSVNTAKRLCDHAAPGEILVSAQLLAALDPPPATGPARAIQPKGKSAPLTVYPLSL